MSGNVKKRTSIYLIGKQTPQIENLENLRKCEMKEILTIKSMIVVKMCNDNFDSKLHKHYGKKYAGPRQ